MDVARYPPEFENKKYKLQLPQNKKYFSKTKIPNLDCETSHKKEILSALQEEFNR